MSKDDFFIGWAETPKVDRRFFFGAGLGLLAGTSAIAAGVATQQRIRPSGTPSENQEGNSEGVK